MAKTSKIAVHELPELTPLEQNRIVRPPEAEHLSGEHWDTLKRNYPEYIIQLSKRGVGMRAGHALQLNKRNKPP
jgi:hypothetical protein